LAPDTGKITSKAAPDIAPFKIVVIIVTSIIVIRLYDFSVPKPPAFGKAYNGNERRFLRKDYNSPFASLPMGSARFDAYEHRSEQAPALKNSGTVSFICGTVNSLPNYRCADWC